MLWLWPETAPPGSRNVQGLPLKMSVELHHISPSQREVPYYVGAGICKQPSTAIYRESLELNRDANSVTQGWLTIDISAKSGAGSDVM